MLYFFVSFKHPFLLRNVEAAHGWVSKPEIVRNVQYCLEGYIRETLE